MVENKHKMLNPILSRFCEIYIPEYMDENLNIINLHQYHIRRTYVQDDHVPIEWFNLNITNTNMDWVDIITNAYERGYSCIDLINWVKITALLTDNQRSNVVMYFHKIKTEYRSEKLLMLCILDYMRNINK